MPVNRGIKIALPGYDAFNDTNPDHFALYTDQVTDYILIKEKVFDTVSVTSPGGATINHALGYVPFCLVFVETSSGVWKKLFSVPLDGSGFWFEINSNDLELKNTSGSTKNFAYHIFYDKVGTSDSSNVINLKGQAIIALAKIGKNAETSTDPNDFIFHSQLNTFKIIQEGTATVTVDHNATVTGSIAHGLSFIPLIAAFAKRTDQDGVFLPNGLNPEIWGPKLGWTGDISFNYISADATYVYFNLTNSSGSTRDVNIRYFLLEKVN